MGVVYYSDIPEMQIYLMSRLHSSDMTTSDTTRRRAWHLLTTNKKSGDPNLPFCLFICAVPLPLSMV